MLRRYRSWDNYNPTVWYCWNHSMNCTWSRGNSLSPILMLFPSGFFCSVSVRACGRRNVRFLETFQQLLVVHWSCVPCSLITSKINERCSVWTNVSLSLYAWIFPTVLLALRPRFCCLLQYSVLLYTGLSKKMDGIWNRYNLKSTGRIYTFCVLKCSEEFKVLDLP